MIIYTFAKKGEGAKPTIAPPSTHSTHVYDAYEMLLFRESLALLLESKICL
jgi:hypothetical protein